MQKKDCLKQITEAIRDNDIDKAVGLWFESYHHISAQEFIKCSCEGGWNIDERLESMKTQKFMYDESVADVEKTYYSENGTI